MTTLASQYQDDFFKSTPYAEPPLPPYWALSSEVGFEDGGEIVTDENYWQMPGYGLPEPWDSPLKSYFTNYEDAPSPLGLFFDTPEIPVENYLQMLAQYNQELASGTYGPTGFSNVEDRGIYAGNPTQQFVSPIAEGYTFLNPSQQVAAMEQELVAMGLSPSLASLYPLETVWPGQAVPDYGWGRENWEGLFLGDSGLVKPQVAYAEGDQWRPSTAVHEIVGHGLESRLNEERQQALMQAIRDYPPDERLTYKSSLIGGEHSPASGSSIYHTLTPYLDAYFNYGTPIPQAILDFILSVTPAREKFAEGGDIYFEDYWQDPGYYDPEQEQRDRENYERVYGVQQSEYPAAPAGVYGSSGVYLGDIVDQYRAGEIDLPTAQYQWNLATGGVAAAEQAARDAMTIQEQMLAGPVEYDNLRQQAIAEGAYNSPSPFTEAVDWLNQGLGIRGAVADYVIDPLAEGLNQAFSFSNPSNPYQRPTETIPVGDIVALPLRAGNELFVPDTPLELLIAGGFGAAGAKAGLSAGEDALRAGVRGLAEAFAIDPTEAGGRTAGLLPALPGQYRAALDLTTPANVSRVASIYGPAVTPEELIGLSSPSAGLIPIEQANPSIIQSSGWAGMVDNAIANAGRPDILGMISDAQRSGALARIDEISREGQFLGSIENLRPYLGEMGAGRGNPDIGSFFVPKEARVEPTVIRLAVAPEAMAPLDADSLIGSRGGMGITDPAGARILQPNEPVPEGYLEYFHGTGPGGLAGDIRVGMNITPDPGDAALFSRVANRLNEVAPPVEDPSITYSSRLPGVKGTSAVPPAGTVELPFVTDDTARLNFADWLAGTKTPPAVVNNAPEFQQAKASSQITTNGAKPNAPEQAVLRSEEDVANRLQRLASTPGGNLPTGPGQPPNVSFLARPTPPTASKNDPITALINYWRQDNDALLGHYAQYNNSVLGRIQNAVAGNYQDMYFNNLIKESDNLRAALTHIGVTDPKQLDALVDGAVQSKIAERFGGGSAEFDATLAGLRAREKQLSDLAKSKTMELNDRVKNTQFGLLDIGIFGQQAETAARWGLGQTLVGMTNRALELAHLPHVNVFSGVPLDEIGDRKAASIISGVHHGIRGSGLKPNSGSIARYIPGVNIIDQYVMTPIVQALTDAQFVHTLGNWRQMGYEGNLIYLKALGQNIEDPAVRRTASRTINNITSAAQTALTPGRGAVESVGYISPAMARSGIGRVLDTSKLLVGSTAERELAALGIANNLVWLTGLGYLLNEQFGIRDYVMDPTLPGFGSITLPTTNSKGEHHIVNLYPQASFERALIRSGQALANADWDKLGRAWGQYYLGREGALLRPGTNLGGYGYDTNGKFHWGDLRDAPDVNLPVAGNIPNFIAASIPIPPVGQNFISGRTDLTSLGLQVVGQANYTEPLWKTGQIEDLEILSNPTKLSQVLPSEIIPLVQGKNPAEVGSRIRDELEAAKNSKAAAQLAENNRKAGDPYQKYFDEKDAIKASFNPVFDRLQNDLRTTTNAYAVQNAIQAAEAEMYKRLAAVEWPGKEGDPAKQTEMQKLESAYRSLWESAPVDADGKKDYKALAAAQQAFIASIPDEATRSLLQYNVAPHINQKDHPILQYLDAAQPERSAYYALPTDNFNAARNQYLIENPTANAKLWATGDVSELRSIQAVAAAREIAPDRAPIIDFNYGYRTNPDGSTALRDRVSPAAAAIYDIPRKDEPGYQPGAWEQWLREHPRENAELFLANHVPNLVSWQAYQLVPGGVRR